MQTSFCRAIQTKSKNENLTYAINPIQPLLKTSGFFHALWIDQVDQDSYQSINLGFPYGAKQPFKALYLVHPARTTTLPFPSLPIRSTPTRHAKKPCPIGQLRNHLFLTVPPLQIQPSPF